MNYYSMFTMRFCSLLLLVASARCTKTHVEIGHVQLQSYLATRPILLDQTLDRYSAAMRHAVRIC